SVSRGLIVLCLALFAFTTVVGWSYYAVRCLAFLTGGSRIAERIYLTLYVLAVAAAPFFPVRSVWMAANICNGLMSVPNLLAILLLSPRLALDARDIMKSTHTTQRRPELYGSALS
ncbi:MAG: alanine:cation symporter family protein, partial [Oscillospiraceae bacterium]|nr:alanine:cation symporter family protein [Oscillospiraceae bacterium]